MFVQFVKNSGTLSYCQKKVGMVRFRANKDRSVDGGEHSWWAGKTCKWMCVECRSEMVMSFAAVNAPEDIDASPGSPPGNSLRTDQARAREFRLQW